MKKKVLILGLCLILTLVFAGCGKSDAEKAMDNAVESANTLLEKNGKPYDSSTKTALKKAVEDSEKADSDKAYKKSTQNIKDASKAYKDSIKQLKQVTKPAESFIIKRVKKVKTVTDVEAATEKTDSNKMLNKKGGYYSYVAMRSSMVKDPYGIYNKGTVDAGTDGGAVIEAFKTTKEAKSRNDYLAGFDTGGISSGSHKVVGTLVVRTSDELTATQQKNLEKNIIDALISLEE